MKRRPVVTTRREKPHAKAKDVLRRSIVEARARRAMAVITEELADADEEMRVQISRGLVRTLTGFIAHARSPAIAVSTLAAAALDVMPAYEPQASAHRQALEDLFRKGEADDADA